MANPNVFLAHASEDKEAVRHLKQKLDQTGLQTWFDELDLEPGSYWPNEIHQAIKSCDVFLACLSENSVRKTGYVQRELRMALKEYSERPPGVIYLIPVKLNACEMPDICVPELGLHFRNFHAVKLWEEGEYDRLIEAIRSSSPSPQVSNPEFKEEDWQRLEKSVRDIAARAGFSAMSYYRNVLAYSTPSGLTNNLSTLADEASTLAALETLFSLDPIAADLGYEYRVFAEELDNPKIAERIKSKLQGNPIFPRIKASNKEFKCGWERSFSILIDPINGTANFNSNIPFFCSSVALFIAGRLSISAIYDPSHNQVFYGSLRTLPNGESKPVAKIWNISLGSLEDLRTQTQRVNSQRCIATHLTRSDNSARARLLKFLPHLYEHGDFNGGTYMLNSGEMALAHVARGNISAFLNNTTRIWDVAAGEVLIRATEGKVTDFNGREIDYGTSSRISVLACESQEIHTKIQRTINEHYPWN